MKRVLVVHHDPDMADQEADSLRRAGYSVDQCAGPTFGPCPILSGRPCPAAEAADVLLYDIWASGEPDSERQLIEQLREFHPNVPIVLTAPGMQMDWVETAGIHAVTPLVGAVTGDRLRAAIEQALAVAAP
jgi:DNA-binding NtrC family response regulator